MRWTTLFILGLILAACTTFEVRIETPSSPNEEAIATLAHLMFEGTQYAQLIPTSKGTPEPNSPYFSPGIVNGKLCYPGAIPPSMILFYRNLSTDELIETMIDEYVNSYNIELAPGRYYAFAWVPQYMVGGLYSKKVVCGDGPDCVDHSPAIITIEEGTNLTNIDICDWGFTSDDLPLPAGVQLLGGNLHLQPIE